MSYWLRDVLTRLVKHRRRGVAAARDMRSHSALTGVAPEPPRVKIACWYTYTRARALVSYAVIAG